MLKHRLLSVLTLCRAIFLSNWDHIPTVQVDFFFFLMLCFVLYFGFFELLVTYSKYLHFSCGNNFHERKKKERETLNNESL